MGNFSLTGGAGATSVAVMIARMLAMEEAKVLYLNLKRKDDYSLCRSGFLRHIVQKKIFIQTDEL